MIRTLFRAGTTNVILLLLIAVYVLLQIAGYFVTGLTDYLVKLHVFEVVSLLALLELLYLQLDRRAQSTQAIVVSKEQDAYRDFLVSARASEVASIDIISAGISARYQFIQEALSCRVPVRVLIQGKNCAVDKADAERCDSFIELIERQIPKELKHLFEVRSALSIVSLRALILRQKSGSVGKAVISWYTYDGAGKVAGHLNPSIILDEGARYLDPLRWFVALEFDKEWETAELVRPHSANANDHLNQILE